MMMIMMMMVMMMMMMVMMMVMMMMMMVMVMMMMVMIEPWNKSVSVDVLKDDWQRLGTAVKLLAAHLRWK